MESTHPNSGEKIEEMIIIFIMKKLLYSMFLAVTADLFRCSNRSKNVVMDHKCDVVCW